MPEKGALLAARLPRRLAVLAVAAVLAGAGAWWLQGGSWARQSRLTREAFLRRAALARYDTIVFGPSDLNEVGLGALDVRSRSVCRLMLASGQKSRCTSPSVAGDGKTIAFFAGGGLEVVNLQTGRRKLRFAPPGMVAVDGSAAWSPDGGRLAVLVLERDSRAGSGVGGKSRALCVIDARTGRSRTVSTPGLPTETVASLELHWRADGRGVYVTLWTGGRGTFRTLRLDASTGAVLSSETTAVRAVALDGRRLLEDAEGLWVADPAGARGAAPLRVEGCSYRFLGNTEYIVYVGLSGPKSSGFFVVDTTTGARGKIAEYGIGVPAGFDLARRGGQSREGTAISPRPGPPDSREMP